MHATPVRFVFLAVTVLLCACAGAFAQAGTLDPTFGTGGIVALATTTATAINAVAVQSDGKIVLAGAGPLNSNDSTPDILIRLNTDGSLDSTFGVGGVFTFNPAGFPEGFLSVAIRPDGKIGAAGGGFLQVVSVLSNGTLDPSFGTGGVTTQVSSAVADAASLALQSNGGVNGEILVAFSCNGCGLPSQMVSYTSVGSLSQSFGTGGFANLIMATPAQTIQMALEPGGKILVETGSSQSFPPADVSGSPTGSLVRYDSNGKVDTTFGALGIVTVLAPQAFLPQSSGKILVAGGLPSTQAEAPGANDIGFGVARYASNGSIDKTFASGGAVITDFGTTAPFSSALALAVQSNGDVVAAGLAGQAATGGSFPANPTSFGLARYTSAGALDTTFGTGGMVITTTNNENSWIDAMALQSEGKIVAAGTTGGTGKKGFTSGGGYVLRYLSQ